MTAAPPRTPLPLALRLRAAAGVIGGPGDLGALGAVAFGARLDLGTRFALELEGAVSVVGGELASGGASASCNLGLVLAWALWSPSVAGRLRPALGLGAGVAAPWSVGDGGAAVRARTDATLVAFVGGGGTLSLDLGARLRLRLDGRVGVLVPEVRIEFGDHIVARLGRPLAEAWLGLEARIP